MNAVVDGVEAIGAGQRIRSMRVISHIPNGRDHRLRLDRLVACPGDQRATNLAARSSPATPAQKRAPRSTRLGLADHVTDDPAAAVKDADLSRAGDAAWRLCRDRRGRSRRAQARRHRHRCRLGQAAVIARFEPAAAQGRASGARTSGGRHRDFRARESGFADPVPGPLVHHDAASGRRCRGGGKGEAALGRMLG